MNPQKYQRRYCVIHDGVFYYYDNDASKKQNGAFHLKGESFKDLTFSPSVPIISTNEETRGCVLFGRLPYYTCRCFIL